MILHWWPQEALLHRMYRPVREYDAPEWVPDGEGALMILHWWPQEALLHRTYRPVREYDAPEWVPDWPEPANTLASIQEGISRISGFLMQSNEGTMLCLDPADQRASLNHAKRLLICGSGYPTFHCRCLSCNSPDAQY